MKTYNVTKIDSTTGEEFSYGAGYTEDDVKSIVKGYSFNGMFYDRRNSKWMFVVEED